MNKQIRKKRREVRTREKMLGTAVKPRLSVFRSNKSLYLQLIDDEKGVTILGVSDKHLEPKQGKRMEIAKQIGNMIAKKASENKITKVIFDRGSYKYHGIVKAIADGAREGGLKF